MRPEAKEYNFDWLMGKTLKTAAKLPLGTSKEIENTYRYIPYFKGVAKAFIDAGPPGIQFLDLLAKYTDDILTAKDRGKMIGASSFCITPSILFAMDIVPVSVELLTAVGCLVWKRGMYDYLDYCCEVGMPETSCSAQRGFVGAYLADLCEKIDFIVCDSPGVCDTNANAFAFSAAYKNRPFFQLNYPSTIGDDRSQKYHVDDFKMLVNFIETQSDKKLDYDRLAQVLEEINKQDALTADLEDMILMVPTPIPPIFHLILYTGRFLFAGHKEYTKLLETMVESAQERLVAGVPGLISGEEKLRVFMCYIDHYTADMNFFNYFEERGIAHMGSILSRNFRDNSKYVESMPDNAYSIDTSSPDAMLDSFAQMNARMPMVRSIRGPYDQHGMWLEESLACAKSYQADCVIYNGTPGCRNTWGMVKPFARDLEKQGYPVHIMYDDAFDDRVESWRATRDRLDEFFHVRGLL